MTRVPGHRLRRALALAGLCFAVAGAGGVRADESAANERAPDALAPARALVEAFGRGDRAAVAKAAKADTPDPVALATDLRALELGGGDVGKTATAVLAELVAAADGTSWGPVLVRARERWSAADEPERDAERRRHEALRVAREAATQKRVEDVATEVLAPTSAFRTAPRDLVTLRARHVLAEALEHAARGPDDETAWRALADDAAREGWLRLSAHAGARAGQLAAERLDPEAAARDRRLAAERFEAVGDRVNSVGMHVVLARSLVHAGHVREAEAELDRVAAAAASERPPVVEANAVWTRALVERAAGRDAEADALQERASALFLSAGEGSSAAGVLAELAKVRRDEGRPADAMALLDRAVALLAPMGARGSYHRAVVESEYVHLLLALKKPAEAIPHADAALRAALESGRASSVANARSDRATALSESRRLDDALAEQRALRAGWLAVGNRRAAASARHNESSTLWKLGRLEEAEAAALEARVEADAVGERRLSAIARSGLGLIVYSRGELARALEIQRGAVEAFDALRDRTQYAVSANRILTRLLERSGRYRESLRQARTTLALQRATYTGLGEEDGAGARADTRTTCDLAVFTALAWQEAEPDAADEAAAAAFEFAEAGRALALVERLAAPRELLASRIPAELAAADASTRQGLASARRRYEVSLRRSPDDPEAQTALGDLDRAWIARDEVVARVQREAARTAAFVAPPPPDLAALQGSLDERTAVVIQHLGIETGCAIVVRRGTAELIRLGAPAEIRGAVDAWVRVASTPGGDDARAATTLSDLVVAPIRAALEGTTHVVVSPDDALSFVPLEALVLPRAGGVERFVERFDVTYAPSASVWRTLRGELADAGPRLLAIGNPTAGTGAGGRVRAGVDRPALPGAEEEARAVAALAKEGDASVLLGAGATLDAVTKALDASGSSFRAVHFACHAVVDPSRPRGSGLVLADGDLLDVDRIARSRWRAEIAVVAACESARGRFTRGEGVIGIPRALILAGIPRAVVSQWVVSDRATTPFMRRFYDGLLRKGLPAAAALREAKLASIRAGGADAHPSAWAPFVLWGRGD